MRKHLLSVAIILALAAAILTAGMRYYNYVSEMIFEESAAHLTEIYHQANQSLNNLVAHNWSTMQMWVPYLQDTQDDARIQEYVEILKKERGFTDFYFISREGEYRTVEGK